MDNEIAALRSKIFKRVFDEFAFLTLRQHAPELLAQMMASIIEPGVTLWLNDFDPDALNRIFVAGAARYLASGQAEAFYSEKKSELVTELSVCVACWNGEH